MVPCSSLFVPSQNVTLPLGVPEPGETAPMVAVKTIFCPATAEMVEAVSVVLVFASPTVSDFTLLVLVAKSVVTLYWAVIEWLATARVETFSIALSFVPRAIVPKAVVPS